MPDAIGRTLIRHGKLEADVWRLHQTEDAFALPPDAPGWMVSLAGWKAHAAALPPRQHPLGIVLPTDADWSDLVFDAAALQHRGDVAFIAVHFSQYGDGRGMSLAWMLREEYGWRGELRALGDVLIDTVHYLARCGFDSFVTKPGHDPVEALASLQAFTSHYQPAYDNPAALSQN